MHLFSILYLINAALSACFSAIGFVVLFSIICIFCVQYDRAKNHSARAVRRFLISFFISTLMFNFSNFFYNVFVIMLVCFASENLNTNSIVGFQFISEIQESDKILYFFAISISVFFSFSIYFAAAYNSCFMNLTLFVHATTRNLLNKHKRDSGQDFTRDFLSNSTSSLENDKRARKKFRITEAILHFSSWAFLPLIIATLNGISFVFFLSLHLIHLIIFFFSFLFFIRNALQIAPAFTIFSLASLISYFVFSSLVSFIYWCKIVRLSLQIAPPPLHSSAHGLQSLVQTNSLSPEDVNGQARSRRLTLSDLRKNHSVCFESTKKLFGYIFSDLTSFFP